MTRLFLCVCAAVALLATACSGDDKAATSSPSATRDATSAASAPVGAATGTPRPLPSPVATPPATEPGFTLADASLEALPGAKTDTGTLGGMTYQIEMPDKWNGRLVVYTHGNDVDTMLHVYPPVNRGWLIQHGYAWAAASYTVNVAYVSGVAADESAALWDLFAQKYGRPAYSYAMGDSMGGAAAFTAAERYGDRYDGALPLCADAPPSRVEADFFYAAAYAAGVTQADYDGGDIGAIIDTRIKPALRDAATRARFDALWTDISGGPRPFVREGVDAYYTTLWTYAISNIVSGTEGNEGVTYALGTSAGVTSEDFNRGVIRTAAKPGANKYSDRNVITGDIDIPTLTVQPTGDALTVFSSSEELRRRVESKGKADLLVQRTVQSPQHCFDHGLSDAELAASFEALVTWVEQGKKPTGEDLLGDVSDAGAAYTLSPRLGSDGASKVSGAGDRVTLTGTITLDGQPVDDAFMWAMVRKDGLLRSCSYGRAAFDDGRYRLTVAAATEAPGCGEAGASVLVGLFTDNRYVSLTELPWPTSPGDATFDLAFSRDDPSGAGMSDERLFGTHFTGDLLDASGKPLGPGTLVEAYIGDTRCGAFSVPPVHMVFDDTQGYTINVAAPDTIAGCTKGGTISFRINGIDTGITGVNDLVQDDHVIDLRQK
jgi:pimeloyl-ACP methyl ester carboxylesterase